MNDMICSRLRELRRKNGYTQSGLAKALGVSQSTVGNWEAGIRRPNLDTLERITRLFGISRVAFWRAGNKGRIRAGQARAGCCFV